VGNTAGDSFFAYAFAVFVSSARETSGSNALSAPLLVSLAISVLFIWTVLNFIRVEDIGWIYNMASVLQIGTILALSIVILSTAPHLNSLSFVFFDYNNSTGFTQEYYVVMLSFLYPLFGFVGYDSPAHLAEETKSSRKVSSMGIIYTVLGDNGVFSVVSFVVWIAGYNTGNRGSEWQRCC
jgi:amino acid transporter